MKIKRMNIEDLDGSLSDYRIHKAKIKRLETEIAVEKGKFQQLQRELEDAQKLFDKEKRKIYSIIEDLYDESKLKD
jgi:signal transduction histidine kinase